MKRLISALLVLMMISSFALADRMSDLFTEAGQTDGYVELSDRRTADELYDLLVRSNDEEEVIRNYGSFTATTEYLTGSAVMATEHCTLIPSPYGRMSIMETDRFGYDFAMYSCCGRTMVRKDGVLEPFTGDAMSVDVDYLWENYLFPFAPIEVLITYRDLGSGVFEVSGISSEGLVYFFYGMNDGEKLTVLRIDRYTFSDEGEMICDMEVSFDFGGKEIPRDVLAMFESELGDAMRARTTGNVNLREGPGLDYETVGSVSKGTDMEYLGESEVDERGQVWYNVSYEGAEGWASGKYVELTVE